MAGFADSLLLFIGLIFVSAALLTAVRPVVLAAAVDFSAESEATTLGIVFATLDGVGAFGALCAGYAGEFDLSYAYALSAALSLASAVLCSQFVFAASTKNAE